MILSGQTKIGRTRIAQLQKALKIPQSEIDAILFSNIKTSDNEVSQSKSNLAIRREIEISPLNVNIESGIYGCMDNPNGHLTGWFPSESSIILGDSHINEPKNRDSLTVARWFFNVDDVGGKKIDKAYLCVASIREFGGLHSPEPDAYVGIRVNDCNIEEFLLRVIPSNQSDYFHVQTALVAWQPVPAERMRTIYYWYIPPHLIRMDSNNSLVLRIGKQAKWDIDYLSILLEQR